METPVEQSLPPVKSTTKTNTLAIISLVTGIVGLLVSCTAIIPVIGWFSLICVAPCGLAALITGIIAAVKVKKSGEKGKGMAIIGIIFGVIALGLACVLPSLLPTILGFLGPTIGNVFSDINTGLEP